jgi:membrane-bound ClpP family serine protease
MIFFYATIGVFLLSGAIMIGHGTRMIYQGIFAQDSVYQPNFFDLFFDWLTLAILGCFVLWFAVSQFYKTYSTYKKQQATRRSLQDDLLIDHPT